MQTKTKKRAAVTPPAPWTNIMVVQHCRICWFCRNPFEQGDIVIQAINNAGTTGFYCEPCVKARKYKEERRIKLDLMEPGERIKLRKDFLAGRLLKKKPTWKIMEERQ